MNTYLHRFIIELQELVNNRIFTNNILFTARAYLKSLANMHVRGIKWNLSFRKKNTFFQQEKNYKRKDSDFYSDNESDKYFKNKSHLLQLHIGLVSQFPLDPTHFTYLGVVRLLLKYLVEVKRPFKLSKQSVAHINNKIAEFTIHNELGRKIRTLAELRRWKASGFRFFILYCGVICFKNKMKEEAYQHFLFLHVSYDIAENWLIQFDKNSAKNYNKYLVSYNVHSRIHICDDVRKFGSLDSYTCFPFETLLGK